MIIQPEWSVTPFSPQEHSEKTTEEGISATKQKLLIDIAESAQIKPKKAIGGKSLLIIIIAIVVILGIISQMLGKGG